MYLLLQKTGDDKSKSYELTLIGVYGMYTDLGSKVIKGSFSVRMYKSFKFISVGCDIAR